METSTQNEPQKGKYEVKDYVGKEEAQALLRQWLDALEQDKDLEVKIRGTDCKLPKEAFQGKFKAEFEIKEGEYEFEMELKWKPQKEFKQ